MVGAVGRWLHFAGRFGHGRRAIAFADTPFELNLNDFPSAGIVEHGDLFYTVDNIWEGEE
jgi:hypothetical protein